MKKLIFLGIGSALVFTMGGVGPASADAGPHKSTAKAAGTTDYSIATAGATRCASCHRTHTAKASMLLKEAQPGLCYSCHGSAALSSDTDVQNGVDAEAGLALRGGGFDYALIGATEATKTLGVPTVDPITGAVGRTPHSAKVPALAVAAAEATTSKHQIDGVTSGTMWGNGAISANIADVGKAAVTLECGSCHDPHGNGNYRILKPVPNDSDAAVEVNIPDALTKVYTTSDYWTVVDRNVPVLKGGTTPPAATETDGYIANASQWCSTCHTRYMAKAPDYSTNSGDANYTYRHTSGRTDKAGVERPNCIQCHVAHGSNAAMTSRSASFTAPDGSVPAVTANSRLLRIDNRGTCVACHNV